MKRKNLSGIFAAVFAVATVITLASCSQDDEYYEDGLFTRAERTIDDLEGNPGENFNRKEYIHSGDTTFVQRIGGFAVNLEVIYNVKWSGGIYNGSPATITLEGIRNNSSVPCYTSSGNLSSINKYEFISWEKGTQVVYFHDKKVDSKNNKIVYSSVILDGYHYVRTDIDSIYFDIDTDVSSYVYEK